MAKLKKGSAAAKIRAKRNKVKVSGDKATKVIKKTAKKLKVRMPHGYQTESGKVRINGLENRLNDRKYALDNYQAAVKGLREIDLNLQAIKKALLNKKFILTMGGESYKAELKRKQKIFGNMRKSQIKNISIIKRYL